MHPDKDDDENDMHKKWGRTNRVDSIVLIDSNEVKKPSHNVHIYIYMYI